MTLERIARQTLDLEARGGKGSADMARGGVAAEGAAGTGAGEKLSGDTGRPHRGILVGGETVEEPHIGLGLDDVEGVFDIAEVERQVAAVEAEAVDPRDPAGPFAQELLDFVGPIVKRLKCLTELFDRGRREVEADVMQSAVRRGEPFELGPGAQEVQRQAEAEFADDQRLPVVKGSELFVEAGRAVEEVVSLSLGVVGVEVDVVIGFAKRVALRIELDAGGLDGHQAVPG